MMWLLRKVRRTSFMITASFSGSIFLLFTLENISNNVRPITFRGRNDTPADSSAQNSTTIHTNGCRANYSFPEVELFVKYFVSKRNSISSIYRLRSKETYSAFLKRLNLRKTSGEMLIKDTTTEPKNSQERFHRGVCQHYLYDPNNNILIQDLLSDISIKPVAYAEFGTGGSQLKIVLTFTDGTKGRFKPMRLPRDAETSEDTFYFSDTERHTAEIASFHLDRVLGFNRAPPVVGRVLNMTRDLADFLSNRSVVQNVYISPAGNTCFIAKCMQHCGDEYPFCGRKDRLEGSVAAELPFTYEKRLHKYPYGRSYMFRHKAAWESDEKFCDKEVKNNTTLYRLLEFSDISVHDFLTGDMDRHEYYTFNDLGEHSFIPVYDNGRGFGRSRHDCMSCLAPLTQCCLVRLSTLAKLIKLYQGPDSLSRLMRESLSSDPLAPILTESHLDALDRRVGKVIKAISDCIKNGRTWQEVVIDDRIK